MSLRKRTAMRPGAIYIVVVMASLMLSAVVLSSASMVYRTLLIERVELQSRRAQRLASSGIEWTAATLSQSSTWRSQHAHNTDVTAVAMDSGTMTYRLIDSDGSLTDNTLDECDVIVTARADAATTCFRATLEPAGAAVNCLSYSLASSDGVSISWFGAWTSDQTIASGGNIAASIFAYLTANCQSSASISGSIYGTQTTLPAPLEMPDAGALLPYVRMGTSIPVLALPMQGSDRALDRVLLSSQVNSLTSQLNSRGVYVIDGKGASILIRDSRIQATLVIKNASRVTLEGAILWEAPRGNYPCLVADCPVSLAMQRDCLSEASESTNFNPNGFPYRGQVDANTASRYPSQLRG